MMDQILIWAKVEQPWQLWLLLFGLIAQVMFFLRWIVQWISSERKGKSHVPLAFWWLSIVGASMLFVYYVLRGEPIGILGQSVGWIVYARNLYFLKNEGQASDSVEAGA